MAPHTSSFVQVTANFRLRITIDQTGESWHSNTSDVRVKGWLYNDGDFRVWNEKGNVFREISGEDSWKPDPFNFNIAPHDNYVFINHEFTVKHNSDGRKSVDFTVTYGDTGSADSDGPMSLGDHLVLDRIPHAPGAPSDPTYTNIKQTSVTVSWTPPADNGGMKITNYRLRRWNETHTKSVESTSPSLTRNVTGLTPGATYIFEVQARNDRDWGPNSGESLVDLSGGGRIRAGGRWRNAEAFIRRPGTHKWVEATPYVRVGGVWKQAR